MSKRDTPALLTVDAGNCGRFSHWMHNLSLRRITTSRQVIPQIDGIRFIAILIIMVDHIFYEGMPLLGEGQIFYIIDQRVIGYRATQLFFSLSGFILALPFARHYLQADRAVDIKAYFKRRLTRLEPPFVMALLLRLIAFLIFSATPAVIIFEHFFASLFYLHSMIYGPGTSISRPAWSLEIEVQFYILAPLLALLFRIRSTALRRAIILALVLGASIMSQIPALLYNEKLVFSVVCHLQYFLAGFLACDLFVLRDFPPGRSFYWDIVGILCLGFSIDAPQRFDVLVPVLNVIVILTVFHGRLLSRFLSLSFVSIVGGMCYSIYLTHATVVTIVHQSLARIPMLMANHRAFDIALLTVSLALMLLVGAIFFILIERPCMDPAWPSKAMAWWSAKRPVRARPV